MESKRITDQAAWDRFVAAQPESQFLQSWHWGEFQKAVGCRVYRMGVYDGNRQVAALQALGRDHGLDVRSLTVYRGPVIDEHLGIAEYRTVMEHVLAALDHLAHEERATHIHVEPLVSRQSPAAQFYGKKNGWQPSGHDQPPATLLIDLALSDTQLLGAQHPKTRYNIGLAQRKGVTVQTSSGEEALTAFLHLLRVTAKRDSIRPHPDAYFQKMLAVLVSAGMARMAMASFANTIVAANIMVWFGNTVTYLHGASGNEHRNVKATYLLQWELMREARQSGARWYDMGGIAPLDTGPEHQWAGITRFKRGFGGEPRQYLGAVEKPVRPFWYRIVRLRRSLRT